MADRTNGDSDLMAKIYDVVPQKSLVNAGEWVVYQVGAGAVHELGQYDGMPSDENFLNVKLGDTNTAFDRLVEIEEEL